VLGVLSEAEAFRVEEAWMRREEIVERVVRSSSSWPRTRWRERGGIGDLRGEHRRP